MAIKLIAIDLDGTLLRESRQLSSANRKALEYAIGNGIEIVIATGRAMVTIPDEIRDFGKLNYFVTSNGSNVIDAASKQPIYTHYISEEGIESVWDYITNPDQMVELFHGGNAYVSLKCWLSLESYGTPPRFAEYVRRTRKPVDDFLGFLEERKTEIENINLVFGNQEKRLATWDELLQYPQVQVTSSLFHNVEIGPLGVSKADAVEHICREEGIDLADTMCIGDNSNDLEMIKMAGIGIAMENAVGEVLKAADFVTLSNEDDGVAYAFSRYLDGFKY